MAINFKKILLDFLRSLNKKSGAEWKSLDIHIFDNSTKVGIVNVYVEIIAENGIDRYGAYTDDFGVATFPTFHKRVTYATVRLYHANYVDSIQRRYFSNITECHLTMEPVRIIAPLPKQEIRGKGYSDYQCLGDPRVDLELFADKIESFGARFTRLWLIDAWASNLPVWLDGRLTPHHATYRGYLPCKLPSDGGQFDLYNWSEEYFQRLRFLVEVMNKRGIVPQLTFLELYSWSPRKQRQLWVPDAAQNLFQNNSNGIDWEGDEALVTYLPDEWMWQLMSRVIKTLEGTVWVPELGNEMPEKPLHYRMRDALRALGYQGPITINRQEDTPGQYDNMQVGSSFDGISLHGKKDLSYLGEDFPREPEFRTFQQFYNAGNFIPEFITLSSDGARARHDSIPDTYNYPELLEVAIDARVRGMNYEHQSVLKMRRFINGAYDLKDADYDESFMRSIP